MVVQCLEIRLASLAVESFQKVELEGFTSTGAHHHITACLAACLDFALLKKQ